ncbi:MAG: Hsp70 family protein [Rhodococcus sp.]|nr:Hsp70 family protein [Rhodococcus sp. (in: high G+C Gram-positive bacteria)]
MGSVLGVSVGASAVRLSRPASGDGQNSGFTSQMVSSVDGSPEEIAAQSIGVVLESSQGVAVTAVACRDEPHAGVMGAALDRQQLGGYQLLPEVAATLTYLEHANMLRNYKNLVFFDLGSSGLTITVVERSSGKVLARERTASISGDVFDRLIRDEQITEKRLPPPRDAHASKALDAQCREAKERLSTSGAVCVPGAAGLLLLSRDVFESLVTPSLELATQMVERVIERSGCVPDAVVLLGGGARIPVVPSVIEAALRLPVSIPSNPELVASEGAALLAARIDKAPGQQFSPPPVVAMSPGPVKNPGPANNPGPAAAPTQRPAGPVQGRPQPNGPQTPPPGVPNGPNVVPRHLSPNTEPAASGPQQPSEAPERGKHEAPVPFAGKPAFVQSAPSAPKEPQDTTPDDDTDDSSSLASAAPPPGPKVAKKQVRAAVIAGVALVALTAIGLGWAGAFSGGNENTSAVEQTTTTQRPLPTITRTTEAPPPPPETTPEPTPTAPAWTPPPASPEPEPERRPTIPGLPGIELPQLHLPPLPRFP